jgi:hypothetical protein
MAPTAQGVGAILHEATHKGMPYALGVPKPHGGKASAPTHDGDPAPSTRGGAYRYLPGSIGIHRLRDHVILCSRSFGSPRYWLLGSHHTGAKITINGASTQQARPIQYPQRYGPIQWSPLTLAMQNAALTEEHQCSKGADP